MLHMLTCIPRAAQSRNNTMDRWTPAMLPTVPEALWRKSPQWVALNRKHALLAASDTVVNAVIRDHCSIGYDDLLGRCARALPACASARLCLRTRRPVPRLLRPSGVRSSCALLPACKYPAGVRSHDLCQCQHLHT